MSQNSKSFPEISLNEKGWITNLKQGNEILCLTTEQEKEGDNLGLTLNESSLGLAGLSFHGVIFYDSVKLRLFPAYNEKSEASDCASSD